MAAAQSIRHLCGIPTASSSPPARWLPAGAWTRDGNSSAMQSKSSPQLLPLHLGAVHHNHATYKVQGTTSDGTRCHGTYMDPTGWTRPGWLGGRRGARLCPAHLFISKQRDDYIANDILKTPTRPAKSASYPPWPSPTRR